MMGRFQGMTMASRWQGMTMVSRRQWYDKDGSLAGGPSLCGKKGAEHETGKMDYAE